MRARSILHRGAALAVLLALAACSPGPSGNAPAADGWYEFQGVWNGVGTRHVVPLGGDRRAALLDLTGSLLLSGPARPGVGFRVEVIALNDTATGLVGRAAWVDEHGDQIFSEITGQGAATGNRIKGAFVGGTGRYAGATGSYTFTWQYVLEEDDGTVQGRGIGFAGRVRVGAAPPVAGGPK